MTTTFPKEYKSPTDLVQLLKTRGLTIANEPKAESYLTYVGYYRFSAYLFPLLAMPKVKHLKDLLAKYPNVDIRAMGFPKDWEKEPLWK